MNPTGQKSYSVYVLLLPTNKTYVGATSRDPKARWANGNGYKRQPVYEDIVRFGWDAVDKFVLSAGLTKEEADTLEKSTISALDSCNPEMGYNGQTGGWKGYLNSDATKRKMSVANTGRTHTEEAKRRISAANIGASPRGNGWHHSPETRKKISESNKGKKRSLEVRERLSAQRKGRTHKGAVMTPEWRENISKSRKAYYAQLRKEKTQCN